MNLFFSVFCVGISILGSSCLVYKSYNFPEPVVVSSKKSVSSSNNPLEIKQEPSAKLEIKEPVASS